MPEKKCADLKNPQLLEEFFRQTDESVLIWIFKCFYTLFFEHFKAFFYCYCDRKSTVYSPEEQLRTAFDHGLGIFYNDIRKKGFEARGGTVRTALFTYCKYQLLYLSRSLGKDSGRHYIGDPSLILERTDSSKASLNDEPLETLDEEEKIFLDAFDRLRERCQALLVLKKWSRLDNEDIANRINEKHGTDLNAGSVNNEVHKCFKQLKKNVDELKGGKQ